MRLLVRAAPLLLLLPFACACFGASWVELGGKRYTVEIANTEASREQGLMFRVRMDPGRGMLFIHDRQEPLAYWMKNTLIPLDILFFDSKRRLVSQMRNVPPCTLGDACPAYPSDAPALYVLELNAGQAEKIGLHTGAKLRIDPHVAPAH
jgi:uncharacterized membrane protein (UPF0127 family)